MEAIRKDLFGRDHLVHRHMRKGLKHLERLYIPANGQLFGR